MLGSILGPPIVGSPHMLQDILIYTIFYDLIYTIFYILISGSPYNKDHNIFGSVLGRPIVGSPHMLQDGCRIPKPAAP